MNSSAIPRRVARLSALLAATLLSATAACAQLAGYYIGVDGRAINPTGTYAGLDNPNRQRLTLLLNHGDHYHGKGVYTHTGPNLGAGTAVTIASSNYLPEGAAAPFSLTAGTGLYAGKLVSAYDADFYQSNLTFAFTDTLSGYAPGSAEQILHDSSGGRWNGLTAGSRVHLVLASISEGLHIGDGASFSIGLDGVGDDYDLVSGFAPVFWVDAPAAPGLYAAQFKLVDQAGLFGDSGTFEFRFEVSAVPEPASFAALLGAATLGLVFARRRPPSSGRT